MADLIADMQRLAKHTKGQPDDEQLKKAMEDVRKARDIALQAKDKDG
jgi:hypothetical protein